MAAITGADPGKPSRSWLPRVPASLQHCRLAHRSLDQATSMPFPTHTPCYQLPWPKGLAGLSQSFTNMLHIAFKLLRDCRRTYRGSRQKRPLPALHHLDNASKVVYSRGKYRTGMNSRQFSQLYRRMENKRQKNTGQWERILLTPQLPCNRPSSWQSGRLWV